MNDSLVQLIVELNDDTELDFNIKELGTIKYFLPMINSYVIEIPDGIAKNLKGIKGVKAVHQNTSILAQMNMARKTVKSDIVNRLGYTGFGIGIAILDTGIAPIKDFTYPVNRIVAFKDFINESKEPYDDNGHGTHVAY